MMNRTTDLASGAYRPDIDGLRAVAVVLVVCNHLGIGRFSGGFIGVDIFFVISGYLIGGIVLREIAAGTFSFAAFYLRRIRRILPALLAMMLIVSIPAYLFLFPPEIDDYAQSLVWALFSASNVYFAEYVGYFNITNQSRPLLHTWSLGVEEQFYLVVPVVLVALCRWWPRGLKAALWLLALASLGLCSWMLARNRYVPAFFYAQMRAWELLLGTLLALYDLPWLNKPWMRNCASALGLVLIAIPAVTYVYWLPFPGVRALSPCLGAALILAAGRTGTSLVGRVLAWRPIVWVGLISYSLYLWHWPIHVLQWQTEFLISEGRHPALVTPAVVAASLLMATLSWWFIERPFRYGRLCSRPWIVATVLPAFLFLMTAGMLVMKYTGWKIPHVPWPEEAARYGRLRLVDDETHAGTCFVMADEFAGYTPKSCLAIPHGQKEYVLVGDSHADVLYKGLHTVFPEFHVAQATMAGCRPSIAPPSWTSEGCVKMNKFIFDDYLTHHHVDYVLLAGFWEDDDKARLGPTITWLRNHGIEPIVFGPTVLYDMSLLRVISIADRNGDPASFMRHRKSQPDTLDRQFAAMARNVWKVRYISFFEDVCGTEPSAPPTAEPLNCPTMATPTAPMLKDDNHLSAQASVLFFQKIKERKQLP